MTPGGAGQQDCLLRQSRQLPADGFHERRRHRVHAVPEGGVDLCAHSLLPPLGEVVSNQPPFGKVMRQIPPGATRPRDVEDRVEQQPSLVAGRTAQLEFCLQQAPHNLPFNVRQFAGVGYDFRHSKPSKPPGLFGQVSFSSQSEQEWILTEVEPILCVQLWERCNELLDARRTKLQRPAKRLVHLFAGLSAASTQ